MPGVPGSFDHEIDNRSDSAMTLQQSLRGSISPFTADIIQTEKAEAPHKMHVVSERSPHQSSGRDE
jgi:hypothetical protein